MSVRTSVTVPAGTARLAGDLAVPEGARGVVLFAHGSGSGRHSPRNRHVAAALGQAGLATLLVVGGRDRVVLELNRSAAEQLGVEHRLEIVPEATHLFEEPGALERVAALAADWFRRWLAPDTSQNGQAGHGEPRWT